MKTIKTFFWLSVTLFLVVGAIYGPLNYHLVVYKSKWHLVEKESIGWDNTYLDLDKHPTRWVTVVGSSQTLRSYFVSKYTNSATNQLRKSSSSTWDRMKRKIGNGIKGGSKWITKEGPGLLKKGVNGVKSGFTKLKKKGKDMMKEK